MKQEGRRDLGGRISALAASLWMLALNVLFYAPLVGGVATFRRGDFTDHFLPFSYYLQQQTAAGRLPLWNPYTYAGHPFWADVQAAVWYPLGNLLLALSLPWKGMAARLYFLQIEAIVHGALAGLFVFLLVRELTQNRWAGLMAGAAFAFSGYVTGYAPLQLAVLRSAVWLPLVMWLLVRAWARPKQWRGWGWTGVAWGVAFLAGHPQTFLHAGYALAAWGLLLTAATWRSGGGPRWRRRVGGVVVMALVAVGLSAAQWMPSWEFVQQSVRANVDYAFVSGGFPLQDSWQLLLPGVLTQYSPLYVGAVGLGLAFCALFAWAAGGLVQGEASMDMPLLPARWGIAFFGGLALFALLASYGGNGFLYPLLYEVAPGWGWFRGQERAAYLVALALSVLAGYGAAIVPQMSALMRRRMALSYGALVTAVVYAFGMLWQLPGATAVGHWQYLWVGFVTLALGLATALMVYLPQWDRRVPLLFVLLVANLFWANFGLNLEWVSPARQVELRPEAAVLAAAIETDIPGGRVYNEFRLYDDYGMVMGAEDVWGSSPLRLARYAALFEQFPLDRMWRLLGVRYVVTWRRELFGPSELIGEFPQSSDTTYIHRLPGEPQRAWLVNSLRLVDDDDALPLLADHQFDLDRTALLALEDGNGAANVEITVGDVIGEVDVLHFAPGKFSLHIESASETFLVVAENWMPGWQIIRATCDGVACDRQASVPGMRRMEPMRANLTLIGILIPPGSTEFDLVYSPVSVQRGIALSLGTMALLVVARIGVWAWRRKRHDNGDEQGE